MEIDPMPWWKHNIVLVLASTLLGFLICEIGIRAAGISYPLFTQTDGDLGSSLRPGAEGWMTTEGKAYVRINKAGLRDREHAGVKPPNTLRIAVLGDSYAEAMQVPLEDAFWAVLERQLNSCPSLAGRTLEVINFGVSGYGTAQELIMLRQRVWAYEPDLIVLAVVATNDIRNNSRDLQRDDRRPYFVLNDGRLVPDLAFRNSWGGRLRLTDLGQWMARLRNSSHLFQVLNEAMRRATASSAGTYASNAAVERAHEVDKGDSHRTGAPGEFYYEEAGLDTAVYAEPRDSTWKQAWQVTEKLLLAIRDEVQEKGAEFLVVTVTTTHQTHPDPAVRRAVEQRLGVSHLFYAENRIRELGEQEGFAVLPLAPLFQAHAEKHQVFLHGFENSGIGRGHWNSQGHRLAGELIAQKLCADFFHNAPVHPG
jgi:hypothetical protein